MINNRYIPLDILRGMTIALMITVNTPGSWAFVYPPFRHADWNGCTLTDLVFPFFLFIIGAAIFFSFKKYNYQINREAGMKVLRRAVLIFVIGLALNAYPFFGRDYEKLRIMGVLQRIGLAYGMAAFAILIIKNSQRLLIFSALVLVAYWGIMVWGAPIDPYGLESNFGRQIDFAILGDHHMWHGKGLAFDPEGMLSTIPSMVSVIAGFLSVKFILNKQLPWAKTILFGVSLLLIGWLWGQVMPINKSLWTSSYVVFTTGWAVIVLGGIHVLSMSSLMKKIFQPFVIFGSNPLFIFVLSGLVIKTYFKIHLMCGDGKERNMYGYIYHDIMLPAFGEMNGSLIFALSHLFVFFLIAWWMYRKEIFVKI